MAKQRHQLRVLLLQIRQDPLTKAEELASFARYCQLGLDQFSVLNVFDTPHFDPQVLDGMDALIVGGSSDASVLHPERYPFVPDCEALLREAIVRKLPTFCSCFGHQLAVTALGGRVIHDDTDYEMGCVPIYLTEAGQQDPLFRDTPSPFMAVSVHRERAPEVPQQAQLLAYTQACSHSFKIKDAPFYTTQFHPEVDKQILIERLTLYAAKYTEGAGQLKQVLDAAVETPESNALLTKFVDRILLQQ